MSNSLSRSTPLALVPGPVWRSFEQFSKGGTTALEEIPEHGVATLMGRGNTYRILHEADFQHLVGLAADIRRLQQGLIVIIRTLDWIVEESRVESIKIDMDTLEVQAT